MSLVPPAPRRRQRLLGAVALALVIGAAGSLGAPPPASAAVSSSTIEARLLARTNRARKSRGLRPLRRDARLAGIAGDRAANLAGAASFSHQAAGRDLSKVLATREIQWYAWGENIAWWPGGLRRTTARSIFRLWRTSPAHWAALMSSRYNYVGFGVEVRRSDGRVFASAVLTESRDHTAARARMVSATRTGTTIVFTWRGHDPPLQTHWAHLRDYDVWYRVDGGTWRKIRNNTTATSLRLPGRAPGHRYALRVRARDRAGNVGNMSRPVSVSVP